METNYRRLFLRNSLAPDCDPFWEFVSGPIHAGGFGSNALDNTFGLQVMYQKAPGKANPSPTEGGQYYGLVKIDAKTGALKVQLKDLNATVLYEKIPEPRKT